MSANQKAFALIGVSVAMIAFQATAIFGITVGARSLLNSEPAAAAMRAASVVASSVAGTIGRTEQPAARTLAVRSVETVAPVAPMHVELSSSSNAAIVSSDDASCYLVGPDGQVRKLDVAKLGKALEKRLEERMQRLESLEEAVVEIQFHKLEQLDELGKLEQLRKTRCQEIQKAQRPTI